MAIPSSGNPSHSVDPVGVVGKVDGEVLIERGAERLPVIGGEHLLPGDRLVSTAGGTAQIQFTVPGPAGKPISGFLQQGGAVVIPEANELSGSGAFEAFDTEGFDFSEAGLDDLPNPLVSEASRMLASAVGLGASVGSAFTAAARPAVQAALNDSQDTVSDTPIPGLGLTASQADAIGNLPSTSPGLELTSLAALQSVTSMADSQKPLTDPAAASATPSANRSPEPAPSEPARPDAVAALASSNAAVASQTAGFEQVSTMAAAAPAMLGKESTHEQIAQGLNEALGLAGADAMAELDAAEAAGLLEDVAAIAPTQTSAMDLLLGTLPLPAAAPLVDGMDMSPLVPAAGMDNYEKLMRMIESFESRLQDLTGLVYSAFEGVGPDILMAKSEFSTLPTSSVLSGLSDAVNTVTQSSGSLSGVLESVAAPVNSIVSGLDSTVDTVTDAVSGLTNGVGSALDNLNSALQDLNGSLNTIFDTVGDLTGTGNLTSTVGDLTSSLQDTTSGLINTATGLIQDPVSTINNLTNNPVSTLLDTVNQVTGGGLSGGLGGAIGDTLGGATGGALGGNLGSTVGGAVDSVLGDAAGGLLGGVLGGGTGGVLGGLLGGGDSGSDAGAGSASNPGSPSGSGSGSGSDGTSGAGTDGGSGSGGLGGVLSDLTSGLSSGLSSAAGALPIDPNNPLNLP